MSDFEIAFNHFLKYPTLEVFVGFVTQVEMMSLRFPADELKSNVIKVMTKIRHEPQFDEIRVNEAVLRMYNVLGNVSQRLGITGIYEQIDKEGHFETSLKFHLQLAEGYGKSNNLEKFKYVLGLARERLKTKMANSKIEAGFRDLVDSYFEDEADYIFLDPDNTMILFNPRYIGRANNRRRSSINMLRRACPIVDPAKKNFFGPKTKSLLRSEFLDNETEFGTSPEEFSVAMLNDLAGDEMDIEKEEESVVVVENVEVLNLTNEIRRRLSIIDEGRNTSDESDSEKKSRVFSQLISAKDDHLIPIRNAVFANEMPPAIITLSPDTEANAFEEIPFDEMEQDDEKLREKECGRKGRTSSGSGTTAQLRRSTIGLDILVENNCLEAGFSDTVHIEEQRTIVIEDTMLEDIHSLASTQNVTTDCSVFCAPESTFVVHSNARNSEACTSGSNFQYDGQSLEQPEEISEDMKSLASTQNVTPDCSVYRYPEAGASGLNMRYDEQSPEQREEVLEPEEVAEDMESLASTENVIPDCSIYCYPEPTFVVHSTAGNSEACTSGLNVQYDEQSLEQPEEVSEDMKSLASTQNVIPDCSIYCYPEPTFVVHSTPGNSEACASGLNMRYDEQSPEQSPEQREEVLETKEVAEDMESLAPTQNVPTDCSIYCYPEPTFVVHSTAGSSDSPEQREEILKPKEVTEVGEKEDSSYNTPPLKKSSTKAFWDDSMDFGVTPWEIITSTPARHVPLVNVEEYFGNTPIFGKPQENQTFVIPDAEGILQSRLNCRKSVALPTFSPEPAGIEATQVEEKIKLWSDESLSEQFGRRLSLGPEGISTEMVKSTPIEVEETGRKDRRRSEVIFKENNPWDEHLRNRIMNIAPTPTNQHEFEMICPKILAMKSFEAGGETYDIRTLLGQGGYANVYKAVTEEKHFVAVKYEIPSCSWEVYICDQMRFRLLQKTYRKSEIIANQCIMQITDAYIFSNASFLVNEYHEFGSLLDNINNSEDPNWHISCFLLVQLAKVIEKVHECGIIHGDIKPDNFMVTRKIDMSWEAEKLLGDDVFVVKLIDWGRAIDMSRLEGREFKGRAGTEGFDCPEMIDGRGWTYQPDFFGYAATMAVLISGKYGKVTGSELGNYSLDVEIKRRNKLRDSAMKIINEFLNILSTSKLPKWSKAIDLFADIWEKNFDISEWRQAAAKFNEACEKSKK